MASIWELYGNMEFFGDSSCDLFISDRFQVTIHLEESRSHASKITIPLKGHGITLLVLGGSSQDSQVVRTMHPPL